ncbi:MAG: glycerophosphodiester phosphodiesterase [Oscillospiraceae bacterium]|nr:glycerophosphodiester phosphodiesterase [Oscillospiraceae bacterium]
MTNIIAHRGANKVAPQNTLPAFQKAVQMGADGFENDVHLTKDGFIVVCHNYDIDETSNGHGLIADLTLEELCRYDFGSYLSKEFAGTKIPRLEEFLELCGGMKVVNIEIKSPRQKNDIVRKTIAAVRDFGLFGSLIISSFDPAVLVECKNVDPACKTGLLYGPNDPGADEIMEDFVAFAKNIRADAVHPFFGFVNEEYIEDAHEANLIVNTWTVNPEHAIESLLKWGCDGIITDVPDFALTLRDKK